MDNDNIADEARERKLDEYRNRNNNNSSRNILKLVEYTFYSAVVAFISFFIIRREQLTFHTFGEDIDREIEMKKMKDDEIVTREVDV